MASASFHNISDSESDDNNQPNKGSRSLKPSKTYTGDEDLFSDSDSDATLDLSPCGSDSSSIIKDSGELSHNSSTLRDTGTKSHREEASTSRKMNPASSSAPERPGPFKLKKRSSTVHSISDSGSDEEKPSARLGHSLMKKNTMSTVTSSPKAINQSRTGSNVSPSVKIKTGSTVTSSPKVINRKRQRSNVSPSVKKTTSSTVTSTVHSISDSGSDEEKPNARLGHSLIKKNTSLTMTGSPKATLRAQQGSNVSPNVKIKTGLTVTSTVHSISDSGSDEEKPNARLGHSLMKKNTMLTVTSSPKALNRASQGGHISPSVKSNETSSADRRPLCEYGAQCYRRNASHLQEYRHLAAMGKKRSSTDKISAPEVKRPRVEAVTAGGSQGGRAGGGSQGGSQGATINQKMSSKDAIEQCQPLSFMLTRVAGIAREFNNHMAVHIKEILAPSVGNLINSAQFNYCIDIPWLVAQYPEKFRKVPLLVVHGAQRAEKASLDTAAMAFDNVRLCQARMDMPYGTHHTKMMFLLYDSGLRIVIHTANLIDRDWYQKTQGVWISPEFPKLPRESATEGDSETHFKRDLLEYIIAYKARALEEWCKIIREHDCSQAKVYIIASIPGRHIGPKKTAFGHLKLRKLLQTEGPDAAGVRGWPLLGQFSSVGSLGAQREAWVASEWQESLSACHGGAPLAASVFSGSKPKLHLIFPTKENVRVSLEGYPAGQSIPYSINTARKQTWFHDYLHQWKSHCRGRSHASPHIKTYLRASPDWTELAWFLVTSANLSKAAWGALEKSGSQLMIRSYELGVLFLPKHFGQKSTFGVMTKENSSPMKADGQLVFPVPYDLPPSAYTKSDKPWIWDIAYKDKPDSHGNMWCPP